MGRALLVALVALVALAGCGKEPLSEQPGYQKAHDGAEIYCTLAGVEPANAGLSYLHSRAYANCVHRETVDNMKYGKSLP